MLGLVFLAGASGALLWQGNRLGAWLYAPLVARHRGLGKDSMPMPGANYAGSPQVGTPYVMHTQPFIGPLKVPCTQPPWGFLQAVDLTTGKFLWKRPIGTGRDSGPMGIASQSPFLMGRPNLGGSINTRGGLVFNGSTLDRYLRAYDSSTGKELWKARLPAGGQATPMTYLSPSGRQIVVIAAGGHQGMMTKTGDYIMAFALPATPARRGSGGRLPRSFLRPSGRRAPPGRAA